MKANARKTLPLTCALLAGTVFASGSVYAADKITLPETWVIAEAPANADLPASEAESTGQEDMAMQDIVRQVEQEHDATVVEIKLQRSAAKNVYEIKLLDAQGRKSRIFADAGTGEIIDRNTHNQTSGQATGSTSQTHIPMVDIINRFEQEYDGYVLEIELEQKDTHAEYEFELVTSDGGKWKLDVDAYTGTVLKQKQSGNVPANSVARIMDGLLSMQETIVRMEAEYDGQVVDIELDRKTTHDEYKLKLVDALGQKWEIEIDARSGEILKRKLD